MNHKSPRYNDKRPAPAFASWRVGSNTDGSFDELVVRLSHEQTIHLEVMDDRQMFVDVAGVCFWLFEVDGVWVLRGPEERTGALTHGLSDSENAEQKRVTALVKKRCANLRKRRREFAKRSKR